MKNNYPPEPKGLLSIIIEWLVVSVATIMLIKYIVLFFLRNWWVVFIVIIIAGGIAAYRIYKRRKDDWY